MNILLRNWHPASIVLSSLTSYGYMCHDDTIPRKSRFAPFWCKESSHVYPSLSWGDPDYGSNLIYSIFYGSLFGAVGIPLTIAMIYNQKTEKLDGKCWCGEKP